jgi:hypothetical protein
MDEHEQIDQKFRANVERVRALVSLYEGNVSGVPGRKPVPVADLLRAAVVLLHATLEDLVRSLAEWKFPDAPAASLVGIWFAGSKKPREKLDLGEQVGYVITLTRQEAAESIATASPVLPSH